MWKLHAFHNHPNLKNLTLKFFFQLKRRLKRANFVIIRSATQSKRWSDNNIVIDIIADFRVYADVHFTVLPNVDVQVLWPLGFNALSIVYVTIVIFH